MADEVVVVAVVVAVVVVGLNDKLMLLVPAVSNVNGDIGVDIVVVVVLVGIRTQLVKDGVDNSNGEQPGLLDWIQPELQHVGFLGIKIWVYVNAL